jgi:hypothetical protein
MSAWRMMEREQAEVSGQRRWSCNNFRQSVLLRQTTAVNALAIATDLGSPCIANAIGGLRPTEGLGLAAVELQRYRQSMKGRREMFSWIVHLDPVSLIYLG